MFRGLANGTCANVFTTLGMRNGHDLVLKQTQVEESALTIGLAGVFSSENEPAEDLRCRAFFRLTRRFASSRANIPECSYGA
jgi:hypothetical protein